MSEDTYRMLSSFTVSIFIVMLFDELVLIRLRLEST